MCSNERHSVDEVFIQSLDNEDSDFDVFSSNIDAHAVSSNNFHSSITHIP